jgi:hypothetical protein
MVVDSGYWCASHALVVADGSGSWPPKKSVTYILCLFITRMPLCDCSVVRRSYTIPEDGPECAWQLVSSISLASAISSIALQHVESTMFQTHNGEFARSCADARQSCCCSMSQVAFVQKSHACMNAAFSHTRQLSRQPDARALGHSSILLPVSSFTSSGVYSRSPELCFCVDLKV